MKALPDTNVFIQFFGNPSKRDGFEARFRRPSLYISAVVARELFAGCCTVKQEKALASFLKPFEKAGRVLTPDYGCFREAGRVLAGLARDGMGRQHRRVIVTDVLIVVTAKNAGAVVITANAGDFSEIEKHIPVRWVTPVQEIE